MLRMVGFGDNAGSGFPAILATWRKESWEEPELIEDTQLNQVTLVLRMEKRVRADGEISQKGAEMEPKRSRNEAENTKAQNADNRKASILNVLTENPLLTQADIAKKLDLTRKQVQTAIKELQEEDLLKREGSNRNGRWVVKR